MTDKFFLIKVDEDLDSDFHYSEHPFVQEYYLRRCQENNISDQIRVYHHYLNFGIDSGLFKNENEKK